MRHLYFRPKEDCEVGAKGFAFNLVGCMFCFCCVFLFLVVCWLSDVGVDCRLYLSVVLRNCLLLIVGIAGR